MFDAIRVVLIEPSHPGNIGAVARAMKTMGLRRLYIVNPSRFPDPEATARASKAADVLDAAIICRTLNEALVNCRLIFGTSARDRALSWPAISPEGAAEKVFQVVPDTEVAFLFGRERTGLTNDELQQCHFQINIPTHPEYSSLNLASALQIISYEIYKKLTSTSFSNVKENSIQATAEELTAFYAHLEQVFIAIDFLDPKMPKHLMARMRRLFGRAGLDQQELNILRGMLKSIQQKII